MNEAAYVRLHSELAAARPEFGLLVEKTGSEEDSWVEYGRKLLDRAETALSRGAIEESWRHLHTAKRFEIYGLERFDEEGNQSVSTKIPQRINQLTVISARGVIGAISALLFYFILRTPLLQNGTILAEGVITAPMMVVGFAAGYTGRMVPSLVARVTSITDTDESNESKDRDW